MKPKVFFLVATGFVLALFSCSNDETANVKDENVTGELSVVVTRTGVPDPPEKPNPGEPGVVVPAPPVDETPKEENIAFTGNDIKFFNVTTREIIFSNLTPEEIDKRVGMSSTLTFYLNDELLCESISVAPLYSSWTYHNLVLAFSLDLKHCYLLDGYPSIEVLGPTEENREKAKLAREENAQKRKAGWEAFIKYLRDAGKIVE